MVFSLKFVAAFEFCSVTDKKNIYFNLYFADLRTFVTANFAFCMFVVVVAATVSSIFLE